MSSVALEEVQFSKEEVYKALCKVDPSKSCGPDGIPGRLLRGGAVWLAEPLTLLYNQSINSGSVPRDWSSSNITPIFKKGSKHSRSNYRPISLTSITVKILERLIHHKIANFLSEHLKLSRTQRGFRSGHSCQTQLLESVH